MSHWHAPLFWPLSSSLLSDTTRCSVFTVYIPVPEGIVHLSVFLRMALESKIWVLGVRTHCNWTHFSLCQGRMKTYTLVEKLLNLSKTFTHLSTQANLHLLLYLLLPMVPQAPNVIASAGSLKDKNLKKKFFNITTMPLPNLKEIHCVTSFEFISTQILLSFSCLLLATAFILFSHFLF